MITLEMYATIGRYTIALDKGIAVKLGTSHDNSTRLFNL